MPVRSASDGAAARWALIIYEGSSPVAGSVKVGSAGGASALARQHLELRDSRIVQDQRKTWSGTDWACLIAA